MNILELPIDMIREISARCDPVAQYMFAATCSTVMRDVSPTCILPLPELVSALTTITGDTLPHARVISVGYRSTDDVARIPYYYTRDPTQTRSYPPRVIRVDGLYSNCTPNPSEIMDAILRPIVSPAGRWVLPRCIMEYTPTWECLEHTIIPDDAKYKGTRLVDILGRSSILTPFSIPRLENPGLESLKLHIEAYAALLQHLTNEKRYLAVSWVLAQFSIDHPGITYYELSPPRAHPQLRFDDARGWNIPDAAPSLPAPYSIFLRQSILEMGKTKAILRLAEHANVELFGILYEQYALMFRGDAVAVEGAIEYWPDGREKLDMAKYFGTRFNGAVRLY